MQTFNEYLTKTESAVRLLFGGIDSYLVVLRGITGVTFVTPQPFGPAFDADFSAWQLANAGVLTATREAERKFLAESFALDTLCGAVFHVAERALEVYSTNTTVPPEWADIATSRKAKYCIGRLVRTVPLGLVIYAARNRHAHYNENSLHEPSATVFEHLATDHGYSTAETFRDPAFDLNNPVLNSCAHNAMALIGNGAESLHEALLFRTDDEVET